MEEPRPKTILFIDDDPTLILAYRPCLVKAGFTVQPAGDGLEAMRLMAVLTPDLIILDLMMPKFNGVEIMGFIRSNPKLKNIPVIVLSMNSIIDSEGDPILATANRRMIKGTCNPDTMLQTIREVLGQVPET